MTAKTSAPTAEHRSLFNDPATVVAPERIAAFIEKLFTSDYRCSRGRIIRADETSETEAA